MRRHGPPRVLSSRALAAALITKDAQLVSFGREELHLQRIAVTLITKDGSGSLWSIVATHSA